MTQLQTFTANSGAATQINELVRSLSAAGLYGIDPATTTGLTLGFYGGEFNGVSVSDGTVVLTASNTNYVVAHRTTGAVTAATSTTNWLNTTTYLQLYQLVAGASTFTIATTSDKRQAYGGASGTTFTGGTLTSALNEAPPVTIASASTMNIGVAAANSISVTGTATITAFDTIAAGAKRELVFAGAATLTHNATSLILPTGANITTAAGDVADFVSLGSGNWRCVSYMRANGQALAAPGAGFTGGTLTSALNEAPQVTLASASTVNIGAAGANSVSISGTTTITAFDTIASGAVRRLVFQGALTFTHNATSLILPGAANITTAAGDVAWMESMGSGNWRCVGYHKASGAAVVAGGTLSAWTEALSTASPNGTVNVSSLTPGASASTNADAAVVPKGTGAFQLAITTGTSAGGNRRGSGAADLQVQRSTATAVASGSTSFAAGNDNTASNSSAVAIGESNVASGSRAVAIGIGNTSSNTSSISIGNANTSSASNSVSIGQGTVADAANGLALGKESTTRGVTGCQAFASGMGSTPGDAQGRQFVLRRTTTSATPQVLTTAGNVTASAANTISLVNQITYAFDGIVIARSTSDWKSWRVSGGINRGANAAATAVGTTGATVAALDATAGAAAWTITATADTTIGGLKLEATGAAATTIAWVANMNTAEAV